MADTVFFKLDSLLRAFKNLGYPMLAHDDTLREFIAAQGPGKDQYHIVHPLLDSDGIKHAHTLEKVGDSLHLNSITLSQAYSLDWKTAKVQTFKKTYFGRDFQRGRNLLTDLFKYQLKDHMLKEELSINEPLKADLRAMGYDADKLFASAKVLPPVAEAPVESTVVYEKVTKDDFPGLRQNTAYITITLQKEKQGHSIWFITSAIYPENKNLDEPGINAWNMKTENGFPTREDILAELIVKLELRASNGQHASEILNKFQKPTDRAIKRKNRQ
jgi:hypothetical protein